MLSLWFYPSWLPSRHSSCPLAPHKRGQKAISFQQTMMWVGARVPLLGFQDSQTEYCIIVYFNYSGYKMSDIVFIFAFDWSSFKISNRDCLQSVQVGNFQAVAFKLWNHIANGHIFICILIFLFVMSCIFSGFKMCLSKQGWPNSSVFRFWNHAYSDHSSYLSQPPQPTVVYFFWAGVLFSIENAKFWPFLAYFDYFYMLLHFYRLICHTFWCPLYRPK